MASSKTINGIPNKYPDLYPKAEAINGLCLEVASFEMARAVVHYNTKTPDNLVMECEQVLKVGGTALKALQLNLSWPDPTLVAILRENNPRLHLILQIGRAALEEIDWDPKTLAAAVEWYFGSVQEVLLDPSDGTGRSLEVEKLLPLVESLTRFHNLGIGVAGGLCAQTLPRLVPLLKACPYLSIDAQSGLRTGEVGASQLDSRKVEAYYQAAFDLFYHGK